MQHFTLTGSYRLGQMLVRVLQGMYPNRHSQLKAREDHDTLVLPVMFPGRSKASYNDKGDFLSDQELFSHAALILGLEVLEKAVGQRKKPILVVACHLTMLPNYLEVLVPFAKFGEHEDAGWVAGALASLAKKSYRYLTKSTDAEICIRRHKKEVHDFGSYGTRVTQRCGSNRPAFALEGSKRRFTFYAACSMLEDQSPRHQTLRGICSNVYTAAS